LEEEAGRSQVEGKAEPEYVAEKDEERTQRGFSNGDSDDRQQ